VNFPSPNIYFLFFCRESWWGHCPWIIFSQIYFTFFMIYVSCLRVFEQTTNRSSKQFSRTNVIISHFSTFEVKKGGSSSRFIKSVLLINWRHVKFILHSLWYTSLVYVFLNLFFQCDLVFVLCFFFSQPDVNITWITGHIHRSIVDKIAIFPLLRLKKGGPRHGSSKVFYW
jgi:hypothetical protein